MTLAEIGFKVEFLRTMVPVMTDPDLDQLELICEHMLQEKLMFADVVLLDQLWAKFGKPQEKTDDPKRS